MAQNLNDDAPFVQLDDLADISLYDNAFDTSNNKGEVVVNESNVLAFIDNEKYMLNLGQHFIGQYSININTGERGINLIRNDLVMSDTPKFIITAIDQRPDERKWYTFENDDIKSNYQYFGISNDNLKTYPDLIDAIQENIDAIQENNMEIDREPSIDLMGTSSSEFKSIDPTWSGKITNTTNNYFKAQRQNSIKDNFMPSDVSLDTYIEMENRDLQLKLAEITTIPNEILNLINDDEILFAYFTGEHKTKFLTEIQALDNIVPEKISSFRNGFSYYTYPSLTKAEKLAMIFQKFTPMLFKKLNFISILSRKKISLNQFDYPQIAWIRKTTNTVNLYTKFFNSNANYMLPLIFQRPSLKNTAGIYLNGDWDINSAVEINSIHKDFPFKKPLELNELYAILQDRALNWNEKEYIQSRAYMDGIISRKIPYLKPTIFLNPTLYK